MKVSEFLDLVCSALNRAPGSLSLDDTPQTVPEWDSIGQISIITTIERRLAYRATTRDMRTFGSLRQLVDQLKKRGALENDL